MCDYYVYTLLYVFRARCLDIGVAFGIRVTSRVQSIVDCVLYQLPKYKCGDKICECNICLLSYSLNIYRNYSWITAHRMDALLAELPAAGSLAMTDPHHYCRKQAAYGYLKYNSSYTGNLRVRPYSLRFELSPHIRKVAPAILVS